MIALPGYAIIGVGYKFGAKPLEPIIATPNN